MKKMKKKKWDAEEIKTALKRKGYTQTRVGRECGDITVTSVGRVIGDPDRPFKEVRGFISKILGIPIKDLWPGVRGWDDE